MPTIQTQLANCREALTAAKYLIDNCGIYQRRTADAPEYSFGDVSEKVDNALRGLKDATCPGLSERTRRTMAFDRWKAILQTRKLPPTPTENIIGLAVMCHEHLVLWKEARDRGNEDDAEKQMRYRDEIIHQLVDCCAAVWREEVA